MTSKYILDALDRARLPISASFDQFHALINGRPTLFHDQFCLSVKSDERFELRFADDPAGASKLYFEIVSTFPAKSSPAGSSESCSAGPPTPMGAGT